MLIFAPQYERAFISLELISKCLFLPCILLINFYLLVMKLFLRLVTVALLFCWSCSSEDPLGLGKKLEIVIPSTEEEPVMEAKGGTHSMTFIATTA